MGGTAYQPELQFVMDGCRLGTLVSTSRWVPSKAVKAPGITVPPLQTTVLADGDAGVLSVITGDDNYTIVASSQLVTIGSPGTTRIDTRRLQRVTAPFADATTVSVIGSKITLADGARQFRADVMGSNFATTAPIFPSADAIVVKHDDFAPPLRRLQHVLDLKATAKSLEFGDGSVQASAGRLYAEELVTGLDLEISLPWRYGKLINVMLAALPTSAKLELAVDKGRLLLRSGGVIAAMPCWTAKPDPWEANSASSIGSAVEVDVDRHELLEAVEQLRRLASTSASFLRMQVGDNALVLASAADGSDGRIELLAACAPLAGDELTFSVDDMLALLRATSAKSCKFQVAPSSVKKPSVLKHVNADQDLQVLRQS